MRLAISKSRTCRFPLPPHPIAAEQVRTLVRLASAGWDIGDVIDNVLVIAVELVTNAAKLGEVFQITVSRRTDNVLIEVWDSSEAAPERQQESVDRVDGRGLLLIKACSKDWGWRLEEHGGKTVWSVIDVPTASSAGSLSRGRM
ncbi:ATP-binding protein [Actinoallomurus iriomotensis]|uniref:Histidine kinase/HSP90-like ATPase domain-containing protein n=1 Tax=Actinoallomurus iriomotensis TaxID=478107 RepID=A0A9W6RPA7_9ACTN|nr:ATP-binding protein [Actinoallomurus iriomotensis]GLY78870.1 hypothetical protein Airi01_071370 [Actinoallomurus iriomotensis]